MYHGRGTRHGWRCRYGAVVLTVTTLLSLFLERFGVKSTKQQSSHFYNTGHLLKQSQLTPPSPLLFSPHSPMFSSSILRSASCFIFIHLLNNWRKAGEHITSPSACICKKGAQSSLYQINMKIWEKTHAKKYDLVYWLYIWQCTNWKQWVSFDKFTNAVKKDEDC